jgi:divalent metal cation (Fe/Co/Zn/Cd) transporter
MKIMQIAGILVALILGAYSVLLIGQIWDEWLEWKTFFKITLTAGVLVVAIGIIAIILKEMLKEKELKKEKYLD